MHSVHTCIYVTIVPDIADAGSRVPHTLTNLYVHIPLATTHTYQTTQSHTHTHTLEELLRENLALWQLTRVHMNHE